MSARALVVCTMMLLLCIAAGMGKITFAPPGKHRQDKQNCFIIKFKGLAKDQKLQLLKRIEGDGDVLWDFINSAMKCNCRVEQLKQLADDDGIEYIEEDSLVYGTFVENTGTSYWNLDRVDQPLLPLDYMYNYQYTGQGIPIYILDTGVNAAHEEFTGRMGTGTDIFTPGGDPNVDCQGHGSHVAGTAAGTKSGTAKLATIVSVRILGCDGSGTMSGMISGINWAMSQTRGVISLSVGGPMTTSANDAVASATAHNFVVVAAAGNGNTDACTTSPASAPYAITVAASRTNDQRSTYSNYGSCVDIFAPGDSILSASNTINNGYVRMTGTSMATPLVAGAAAACMQGNPSLTAEGVAGVLKGIASSGVVSDTMGSPNLLLQVPGVSSFQSRSTLPSPSMSPVFISPSPIWPSNDQCSNAMELPCNSMVQGSTITATFDESPVPCNTTHTAPEVWYCIDVPEGQITLSTCNAADFDTQLTLWGGPCSPGNLSGLQCIASVDDSDGCGFTTSLTQTVTAGQYLIMVHGYTNQTGSFNLSLQCPGVSPNSPMDSPSPSPTPRASPSPFPSASSSPTPSIANDNPSFTPSSSITPNPSPSVSPSPYGGQGATTPKVNKGKQRGTLVSMYDVGMEDWEYSIGAMDQITSLGSARAMDLASAIDDTIILSYKEGFHAHVLTQQSPHFILSISGQAGIIVSVLDWGTGVAKAVVTSFTSASASLQQLGLPQYPDPYVLLCQVDRFNEDGQLANTEPFSLTVVLMVNVSLEISLHTVDQRNGVNLATAGGYLLPNGLGNEFTLYVPHTSLIAIRAPLSINLPHETIVTSNNFASLGLVGLVIIIIISGTIAGIACYRYRKSTVQGDLQHASSLSLWSPPAVQRRLPGSAAPEPSPSFECYGGDSIPLVPAINDEASLPNVLLSPASSSHV